jgi:ubiquinone/menaquinone biosynthesis C-methylase UbiE
MTSALTPQDWHQRFQQQAHWTHDLRAFLYPRAMLSDAKRVLDLGCGTGVLFTELSAQTDGIVFGLDLQYQNLALALENEHSQISQGDAHHIPFPSSIFDISLCHFLLLWVLDPARVIGEMVRVTRPGGLVMALAEPDYGGRIDYPPELEKLGIWQIESLQKQGADPFIGRKLSALFHKTGLQDIETGIMGGQWRGTSHSDEIGIEWSILESDLGKSGQDDIVLDEMKELNAQAWASGERVLFVPTFYAIGWVK